MIGRTIANYEILEKLGEGGMGVVYKARDVTLGRSVALKFLHSRRADEEERHRFIHEAQAASALDHPNICTVHQIGEAEDGQFIAMAYYEGETLQRKIEQGPLAVDEAAAIAQQIASGLAKAHAGGITHRDLKPSNIMLTTDGLVKILDFGLAKLAGATKITKTGSTMGTPRHMSPEQVRGEDVDPRSDVWSFGTILYEMLTGRPAFAGGHEAAVYYAIVNQEPESIHLLRADLPESFQGIVKRSLVKDREKRVTSAAEIVEQLQAIVREMAGAGTSTGLVNLLMRQMRRPRIAIAALAALTALTALASWAWVSNSRINWARNVALPEAKRLSNEFRNSEAWLLLREAGQYIPEHPELSEIRNLASVPVSIRTTPPGAAVSFRDALATGEAASWEPLGTSPLEEVRVPYALLRVRFVKAGFETTEVAFYSRQGQGVFDFELDAQGTAPPGMVRVPAGLYSFGSLAAVELQHYWIDKYEVTNRQFQEFVDAGGYRKRDYWKHPFLEDGKTLSWEEAAAQFRDTTGRPGPSTWELETFPKGQEDFPVAGVSWYEATAYCDFAGKGLPTIFHWDKAAGSKNLGPADIVRISNFDPKGPAAVGTYRGLGPYGTYDMAGNVQEWCWNESGGLRYILGGAWGEPHYMFAAANKMPPFDRSRTHGIRCAKYSAPLPEAVTANVENVYRDPSKEKPVSDEAFRLYKSIYAYDRGPLNARVELVDESPEHWRKEKITFDAAYGGERVIAWLYLPKGGRAPYQTVVYMPGAFAFRLRSSEQLSDEMFFDFIIRSGRAVLHPVYQDTYERRVATATRGTNFVRDRTIQWSKDLGRSIDYLETRNDIDKETLAYYGLSLGASWGAILTAVEGRFKASILMAGGLFSSPLPAEVEPLNFAPRATVPALMLNGRYDFGFPLATSQVPLFRLLGAPEKDKRHVVYESGHHPPRQEIIKEVLNWLDRYLGPVR